MEVVVEEEIITQTTPRLERMEEVVVLEVVGREMDQPTVAVPRAVMALYLLDIEDKFNYSLSMYSNLCVG
jgi:hypothetical protein